LGGIGEAFLPDCLAQSDLLVLFGTAVYEERFFPSNVPVIKFSSSTNPVFQKHPTVFVDPEIILAKLKTVFPERLAREEWRLLVGLNHQARINLTQTVTDAKHPLAFFKTLAGYLPEDATITLDVGEFVYWFDTGFLASRQRMLLSSLWRSMGGGIPAGIAACLNDPGHKTITLTGDGGFLMSLAELATINRLQLPLTVFVLRNQCYGLEIQKMRQQNQVPFGTDLTLPDLVKLAESFNIRGYRISNQLEGGMIIHEALQNSPALVDVEVNQVALPNL
jgi:thiamine pyrophosphate-dependent acetolactate synthase large subunit-like protein